MAKYAVIDDNDDPVIALAEADLENADAWLDAELHARGIDPVTVDPALPILNRLALHYALRLAAVRSQADEGGVMPEKARQYELLLRDGLSGLTRAALGLSSAAGFGSATLGRG